MRLAYLSTDSGIAYGGPKGASVHVQELAAALAEAGAEVLLVVPSCTPDAPPPPAGVTVEVLPGPGKGAMTAERLGAEGDRADWLEERLGRFATDTLYERLALHSAAGSVAARALDIAHVVELNAPLLAEAERYRRLDFGEEAERLEHAVLTEADVVLAVSRPLAAYARSRGARRVEVLPNAVSASSVRVRRSDHNPPVAVFTGSLRPWHGIDSIAEAWALLGDKAPELLVVGDGPGRALLEAAGARVTGPVPHSEVPNYLAEADIGLAPYARDAPDYFSPLKLFEYLAAGLATIAADLPGVRDVVTEETAVLVPQGDAPALAEAVATLAADRERRRRLGEAGSALVGTYHTWQHRAQSVLALVSHAHTRVEVGV
jgi:glycosyltransferase involved in cell wall biosynthesis